MKKTESFLVGVDFTDNHDISVLVVGKKRPNESMEVINAFQGKEAEELYKRLITVRKG